MLPAWYSNQVMTIVVMVTWDIGTVHENKNVKDQHVKHTQ